MGADRVAALIVRVVIVQQITRSLGRGAGRAARVVAR